MSLKRGTSWVLIGALICSLISCASVPDKGTFADQHVDQFELRDPLASINKPIFSINLFLDRYLFRPIDSGYRLIPSPVRDGVDHVLSNLSEPWNMVNGVLQLDADMTATSFARFSVNTTVGVLGVMDVAGANGLAYQDQDFSKTLSHYGVGEGDYLVLPVLGPSTVRDTFGLVVDNVLDPLNFIMTPAENNARDITNAINTRDQNNDVISELYYHSIEPYSATRAAYLQHQAFH